MPNFFRVTLIFVLVFCFTAAAFSQTVLPKSVLINTSAFYDEKTGITKLVSVEKQIENEFAKDIKELEDGTARLSSIASELEKPVTAKPAPGSEEAFAAAQRATQDGVVAASRFLGEPSPTAEIPIATPTPTAVVVAAPSTPTPAPTSVASPAPEVIALAVLDSKYNKKVTNTL